MKPNVERIIISEDATIYSALDRLNSGATGTLFVVDKHNKISGVLTDGDIRRALLKRVRIEDKVAVAMNRGFIAARQYEVNESFLQELDEKVSYLPIVDKQGEIVDYYSFVFRTKIPLAIPYLNGNEAKYVNECLATNWISSKGKFVRRFEEQFARFCGVEHGIATCNGTAALHLVLAARGIGPGDEVIVPSLTFIATVNAVTYTGAKPVFVDSSLDTWGIDPYKARRAITSRTRAIIPVHLYGSPVEMDPILEMAEENSLFIIEDAAEAHGAKYKGKVVGGIGHSGCFSFFGNKIITTGEGGMIVTNDIQLAEKARILRDHGMDPGRRYWHPHIGYNYRMTNLQGAVGCAQLERIEAILTDKRRIDAEYRKRLEDVQEIRIQKKNIWSESVNWIFSILIDEEKVKQTRDEVIESLRKSHIESRPFFYPVHKMPPYLVKNHPELKIAEMLSRTGLSLPSYAGISEKKIDWVCQVFKKILV